MEGQKKDEEVLMKVNGTPSKRNSERIDSTTLKSTPMRWLTRLFGCWHKKMSPPFTHEGDTYRTCMNCGARRQFNVGRGKMTGAYYHTSPSALYKPPSQ
jgi:hypothetical protein